MKKKIIALAVGFVLVGVVLGACEEDSKRPSTTVRTSPTPAALIEEKATLPDLTAMTQQDAQDTAQSIGFFNLREEDASGMGRLLLWDRNWIVCEQDPLPGLYAVGREVTLYAVKVGEVCP